MTRHRRAGTVAHKVVHVAGIVGGAGEAQPLFEPFGGADLRAVARGCARATEDVIQSGAVGIEVAHRKLVWCCAGDRFTPLVFPR